MVRDPSIVSPSLTGVFIGGGHNKHGTGSRCTLPKQCRPPSPRRRWRCDRSSYKRSLFSRIRDSQMHYLTGPETAETPPSPSRIHVGSNHSGMGKPWLGVRGGPHPGASHQRDCCGRRRPILHKCKNHTSSDKRSMEDTKRRRSNERPGVSQRHSQLRSVTGVAVSPTEGDLRGGVAPPACICATVFCPLSRLMEQFHWQPPTLKGGRARRGRRWLLAIRLGSARACL